MCPRSNRKKDGPPNDAIRYLGAEWLGQPIDQMADPWFRFGRLLCELDDSSVLRLGARWLDLGCHQGQFAKLMALKYQMESVGIDDWDPRLKSDTTWSYLQSDLNRGFDAGGGYAYVSALEVLEHIIDTDAFLERCRAQLLDGGHLALTTPNINSLRNRASVPFGAYPAGLEYRNLIHHVRLYNVDKLRSHLAEQGFAVHWVRGVSFLPRRILKQDRPRTMNLDRRIANRLPQLCGNVMVLARKLP